MQVLFNTPAGLMPTLPKLLSALPRRCTLSAAAAIISVSHIPTMFGTLVSTGLDRETLEFIENPDPVAAVRGSVQDTIRVACIHCRLRKLRLFLFRGPCPQPRVDTRFPLQYAVSLSPNKVEI